MTKRKLDPIVDSKSSRVQCQRCNDTEVRDWIRDRVKDTLEAKLPRPMYSTFYGRLVERFGKERAGADQQSLCTHLKKHESLWPPRGEWPGESGP